MGKILIAYATKTGSTKEVAEEIGRVLGEKGLDAVVLPITGVQKLDGYSGVVIGAPINGMRWVPEAVKFVEDNRERLADTTTAYFLLSYILPEGRNFWKKKIKASLNDVKEKTNPVMVGMFGGKVASGFPAPFRLLFGIRKEAPMDVRDWDSIRLWAEELVPEFAESKQENN